MKKITCAQDIVKIKCVKNGIIETTDGEYLKIVEVDPINFHLRSSREKNEIIYSFASWIKIAPIEVQFKVLSQRTNIQKHIDTLNREMAEEENEKCRELQRDYLNLLCTIGLKEGVSRRFFVVLKYASRGIFNDNYPAICNSLNTMYNQIKSYLKQCGNKIIEHSDEDVFVTDLYYNLFNRNTSEDITKRIKNIFEYQQHLGVESPDIQFCDIVAPYKIQVKKDHMIVNDNQYYSFLYITSHGYKTQVYGGWLSTLINMGEGIDVDVYFKKEEKSKVVQRIGQKIRLNKAKIKDSQDTNTDFDDLSNSISGGYFLKNGLASGQDFYYMNIMITIVAKNKEELDYKVNFIKDTLISIDMASRIPKYYIIDAYKSSMPCANIHKKIDSRSRRNVLTDGVASTYPFTSFEMSDDNGILLGVNEQNNSLCILDLFDSSKYKNANMAIIGTTGSGKTFTMQLMALRMRMKNIQTFILAPWKGREFKRACKSIGGEFVDIGPGSNNSINVLEIRPEDTLATDLIDDEDSFKNTSFLAHKIQNLSAFFMLLIPDVTNEEMQLIDNALIETYKRKGITFDNNTLIDKEKTRSSGNKLPTYKEMPILGDLYEVLRKDEQTRRIANILDRYVHGSASAFNRQTNIDLNNKYIVIDISTFPKELLSIGMFIALDLIYSKAKEDITKRKSIYIDEAWRLIGAGSNTFAADYVLEIFKIIRGYGGSAVIATQDIGDFMALEGGKYGKGILANAKTKVVLQLETKEARTVKDIFELSEREILDISRFERGHGLIITNTNNIPVNFKASKKETDLISTDRADAERIYNEKVKSQKNKEK